MESHLNSFQISPPSRSNRQPPALASGSKTASASTTLEKVDWREGKVILLKVEREWKGWELGRNLKAFAAEADIHEGCYLAMRDGAHDLTKDDILKKFRPKNLDPLNQLRPYDAKLSMKRARLLNEQLAEGPSAPPQAKSRRLASPPEFGDSPMELYARVRDVPISLNAEGHMSDLLSRAADKYRANVRASDIFGQWPDFGINSQAFRLNGNDVEETSGVSKSEEKHFKPTKLKPETSVVFYNIVDPANTRSLAPSAKDWEARQQHLCETGALTVLYHPGMDFFFTLDPENPEQFKRVKHPKDPDA